MLPRLLQEGGRSLSDRGNPVGAAAPVNHNAAGQKGRFRPNPQLINGEDAKAGF